MFRRSRRLSVSLLSLAFLCAQLGMAVHASSHFKAETHKAPAQVCVQCASFAPLQNMVGGGVTVVLPAVVFHERAICSAAGALAPCGTAASFRSRAPPHS